VRATCPAHLIPLDSIIPKVNRTDYDIKLHPEDGGSMDLRNVGILLHPYKAL